MKKLLLIAAISAALFSCKKEESNKSLALSPGTWLSTTGAYQFTIPTENKFVKIHQSNNNLVFIHNGQQEVFKIVAANFNNATLVNSTGDNINMVKK